MSEAVQRLLNELKAKESRHNEDKVKYRSVADNDEAEANEIRKVIDLIEKELSAGRI